ncbi:uncharacterized protein LOC143903166 [Temnothorax americanus]|uniref:uncharacterized protein LOC143903166 n=1 Tax=Temnothorax americanus TaxID=1964332 RepID=UPI0040693312
MQNHIAFATNKLLGAKGKVTHDKQWQHLTEKLNSIEGPSKTVDNWKKLWCDQRNQARARAAKGKAQRQLTGNIGEPVQLKDSDLKILSIIGGESSVGLPVKEVGLGEQPEDMVDATLILGLTNDPEDIENTDPQEIEDQAVHEEQAVREEQVVREEQAVVCIIYYSMIYKYNAFNCFIYNALIFTKLNVSLCR